MTQEYLKTVYDIGDADAQRAYYDTWADSYDAELTRNGYATPARCAAALAGTEVAKTAAILDMGCGTGLGGQALADVGFTAIDGTDVSAGMLAVARSREIYRHLWVGDPDAPPQIPHGAYDAIMAAGVIGPGAGPAAILGYSIAALSSGGVMVFSLNDHALEVPEYPAALQAELDTGRAEILDRVHGPHLPSLGIGAWVYTLRRL